MRIKIAALMSSLAIIAVPVIADATVDIYISNNTDSYGTGKLNISPCSSSIGDNGVVKPHQQDFKVPGEVINAACLPGFGCTAHIFLSENCSGKEIATAKIDKDNGVVSVSNHDKEHYQISGGGTHLSISPTQRGFLNWIKSIF